jgi:hypothetical protein
VQATVNHTTGDTDRHLYAFIDCGAILVFALVPFAPSLNSSKSVLPAGTRFRFVPHCFPSSSCSRNVPLSVILFFCSRGSCMPFVRFWLPRFPIHQLVGFKNSLDYEKCDLKAADSQASQRCRTAKKLGGFYCVAESNTAVGSILGLT